MQLDKDQVISFLKEQGHHDKASDAEKELPDKVDTDEHSGLLSKYGVDVQSLIGKFTGGGGGGLGGLLGH